MTRDSVPHYTAGPIECIDYIASQGWMEAFCLGNIVKYATRCMLKGEHKSDLGKIRQYAMMLEDYLDGREE